MSKPPKGPWDVRWTIQRELGKGGQGSAWLVESKDAAKQVAVLKILHSQKDAERRARMNREAGALKELRDRGVPKLLDGNTEMYLGDEKLYIVTEYIPGPTLEKKVEGETCEPPRKNKAPLAINDAIALCRRLVEVVTRAHEKQIGHRDIKPDNIVLRDDAVDDPVLIDFGQSFNASFADVKDLRTDDEQQMGNRFLSLPELQVGTDKRTFTSDVTSLAGILFYCLVAEHPVVLRDKNNQAPHERTFAADALSKLHPPQRKALKSFFDRAFQNAVSERYRSADEVRRALNLIAAAEGTDTRTAKKSRVILGSLAVVAVAVVAVAYLAATRSASTASQPLATTTLVHLDASAQSEVVLNDGPTAAVVNGAPTSANSSAQTQKSAPTSANPSAETQKVNVDAAVAAGVQSNGASAMDAAAEGAPLAPKALAGKQKAIDAVHDLFAVDARALYVFGLSVRDQPTSRATLAQQLGVFRDRYRSLQKRMATAWNEYREYRDVVGDSADSLGDPQLAQRTDDLIAHIAALTKDAPTDDRVSQVKDDVYYAEWENALNGYSNLIASRRETLAAERSRISAGTGPTSYDQERRNAAVSAFLALMDDLRRTQSRASGDWTRWNDDPDSVSLTTFDKELTSVDQDLTKFETSLETQWFHYETTPDVAGKSPSEWTEKSNAFRATARQAKSSVEAIQRDAPDDHGSRLKFKSFMKGWKDAIDFFGHWVDERKQFLTSQRQ